MGPVPRPRTRTDRTRGIQVAEPRPPAPEGGRPGEGQRSGTPDAPHNGGRPPGNGGPPPPPRHTAPIGRASQGDSAGPPQPHNRTSGTAADPDRSGGGGGADLRRPSRRRTVPPPRGRPSATPTARNAGPQRRTLWGRSWAPTPAPTAPGTHGPRNPGCPPPRTVSRGRDGA